jgi:hypothetical protein
MAVGLSNNVFLHVPVFLICVSEAASYGVFAHDFLGSSRV